MTHLCSSFQGNQLVITLHTIHFYQKDWNPQIHLHLICGNLKGIYSFPQVLCHCYECAMKHTKCQKSSSTLRKPSYFLRKNVTFSKKKRFFPTFKSYQIFQLVSSVCFSKMVFKRFTQLYLKCRPFLLLQKSKY